MKPQWRRHRGSMAHWLLMDGKRILAEAEGVIGNPRKPACYRVLGGDAEIAANLPSAKRLAEEKSSGLLQRVRPAQGSMAARTDLARPDRERRSR